MASPVGVTVRASLPDTLVPGQAPSALAPMQDVTSLPYMQVVASCGPPDYFFTEYFRVHEHSRLEPHILRSITENESGRPVFAQLIGERPDDLRRTIRDLLPHPVAGIDLNMGCPAPKVYKKNVGGGLLRNLADADRALGVLREAVPGLFTVKMRVGFEDDSRFDELLGPLVVIEQLVGGPPHQQVGGPHGLDRRQAAGGISEQFRCPGVGGS